MVEPVTPAAALLREIERLPWLSVVRLFRRAWVRPEHVPAFARREPGNRTAWALLVWLTSQLSSSRCTSFAVIAFGIPVS